MNSSKNPERKEALERGTTSTECTDENISQMEDTTETNPTVDEILFSSPEKLKKIKKFMSRLDKIK